MVRRDVAAHAAEEEAPLTEAEKIELAGLRKRAEQLEKQIRTLGQEPGVFNKNVPGVPAQSIEEPAPVSNPKRGPGIYKCVQGPVRIRAAPSRNARALSAAPIPLGDLVRIVEVPRSSWGRMDEDEIWARMTDSWPRRPVAMKPPSGDISMGEDDFDEDAVDEQRPLPPQQAFVLLDGEEAGVGISGPLFNQLPTEEAEPANWRYRDAMEMRLEEQDAVRARNRPAAMQALRQKFVRVALSYVGTPCKQIYHDPASPQYLPQSKLFAAPLFLDSVQFVQQVVGDLKGEFGFELEASCRLNDLYRALPKKLEDEAQLEPGDLIFCEASVPVHEELLYGGMPRVQRQKRQLVHVEIFIGGKESVGSMPWCAHRRTGKQDGVQRFPNYHVDYFQEKEVLNQCFCSLRPWLLNDEISFAHGWCMRERRDAI
mmetsp:Transcript_80273/g.186416  ORF Transcript_80273/g.186416 Transcript_80273/m.186416 type:complete len:427 (+) Transcript_80273:36-1316(+)